MNRYLSQLDNRLLGVLKKVTEQADKYRVSAYLVGGTVRDIILGRDIFDLDIVLEADIVFFVRRLADILSAEVVVHKKFGTATLYIRDLGRIDFATARREFYSHPGALPQVVPGRIEEDLFRRDFTINAMAIRISGPAYGELIDLFGGMDDICSGKIRVLHDRSFIDDPTRIIRAVRFEQRFSFRIERKTLFLMKKELGRNRNELIRHRLFTEFKKFLRETNPIKCIKRLYNLNGLKFIDRDFILDIRHINSVHKNIVCYYNKSELKDEFVSNMLLIYLMAIFERVEEDVFVRIKERFHFSKEERKVLLQSRRSSDIIKRLKYVSLRPSETYRALFGLHIAVVFYLRVRTSSNMVINRIDRFLEHDRFVSIKIRGTDVERLTGLSGKDVGKLLNRILFKKIDYDLSTKKDEIEQVISYAKNGMLLD